MCNFQMQQGTRDKFLVEKKAFCSAWIESFYQVKENPGKQLCWIATVPGPVFILYHISSIFSQPAKKKNVLNVC